MARFNLWTVATAALACLLVIAGAVPASTPPSGSVAVPTTIGQTVTHTWTGTILPGANPTSSCAAVPRETTDQHAITVNVPAGVYDTLKAVFTFRITWGSALHDEILTVLDPQGVAIASSDGGSNVETIVLENLKAGTYTVLACPFAAAIPVDYSGLLEVRTEDKELSLAAAPAQGLEFSAAVATDNQRDQAEPLVEIDPNGNIYACGPSGFSQFADYFQVSTDGGDQFHLLGTPPRGQAEGGGGGDCTMAFSPTANSAGNHDLAFSGLGPLTGFATGISPNNGRSIATSGGDLVGGATEEGFLADRQWETFVDANTVLLIYNVQVPRNTVVIRSADKGLTFNPADAVIGARSPLFPGPIRYDAAHDLVYFGWDDTGTFQGRSGDFVNLSISRDRGRTWTMCVADHVEGEVPGFVTVDHDRDGNIYVGYGDSGAFHTYMRAIQRANLDKCISAAATTTAEQAATRQGAGTLFGPRVQVDREAVRTTVFPWMTAGGAPGRVAFMFAGTDSNGDPNSGGFNAAWHAYANVSTNALAADATFSQVKATTHPFHYDSICLQGLGCDLSVPPGDRSMADFLAIDYSAVTDRLTIVINRTNKLPDEPLGHVASPMAVTQIGGPTLGGRSLTPTRPVLRTSSSDPTGDAVSLYSVTAPLVVPPDPSSTNEPAADFTSVSVGPEIDLHDDTATGGGGFTVTMKVADLSTRALLDTMARTQSQSLLWLFRFTNGQQDVAAAARFNPVQGFTFGYNEYTTGSAPCEPSGDVSTDKCVLYPGDQPIPGQVDEATGRIRLVVPGFLLRALGTPDEDGRPTETAATVGSRFYDATAWSLGNTVSPVQDVQSFLYPLDNTPAMDFLLQQGRTGGKTQCTVNGAGSIDAGGGAEGKFSVDAHADGRAQVAYRDKVNGIDFNSTTIASVSCGPLTTIRGSGLEGDDEVTFTAEAVDGGESSSNDRFRIELSSGYERSGTLLRGNIQVRK